MKRTYLLGSPEYLFVGEVLDELGRLEGTIRSAWERPSNDLLEEEVPLRKRVWITAGLSCLVLLGGLIAHYLYYERTFIRPEGLKALEAVKGFRPEQIFAVPPGALLQGFRSAAGNAAEDYDRAFTAFDLRLRPAKEIRFWNADTLWPGDRDVLRAHTSAPELGWVESGAAKLECLFTSKVYPIPTRTADLQLPRLRSALNLSAVMIEKARQAEEQSDVKAAEQELLRVVSLGHHLEGEYNLATYLVGVKVRIMGTEALQGFYTRTGRLERAAACTAQTTSLRNSLAEMKPLYRGGMEGLTLTPEGRAWIERLFDAPGTPNAVRAELALVVSYSHLFFFTKRLYGPERDRRRLLFKWSQTKDPVLKELVEKCYPFLNFGLKERFLAVERAAVIN